MAAVPPAHLVDCTFCGARGLPVPFQASSVRCSFCGGLIPINTDYWQAVLATPTSPTSPYTQVPVVSEPGISDLEKAQIEIAIQKSLQESRPNRRPPSVSDDDLELALVLSLTEEEQRASSSSTTPNSDTANLPGPSKAATSADPGRPISADMAPSALPGGADETAEGGLLDRRRKKKTADEVAWELQQELQLDGNVSLLPTTSPPPASPLAQPVTSVVSPSSPAQQLTGAGYPSLAASPLPPAAASPLPLAQQPMGAGYPSLATSTKPPEAESSSRMEQSTSIGYPVVNFPSVGTGGSPAPTQSPFVGYPAIDLPPTPSNSEDTTSRPSSDKIDYLKADPFFNPRGKPEK